jgi:hypothetical protein
MFATIAFWKEERRDQRGSLVLKRMASKLPILLKTLGIIVKGALNLGSTGGFSTKSNNNVPDNCTNLTQNVQICRKVKPESKQGLVLGNYCKAGIRIIYLFLFLYIFSSSTWAQENVLRFAWTPNKDPHLSHYVIYRDTEPGTMKMLDQIPKTDSTYTDDTVEPGVTYYYKLTAVDTLGYETEPSNEVTATVGSVNFVNETDKLPNNFEIRQNYPNPFNPKTTIEYSIPNRSFVKITIYNVLGQDVRKLVNEFKDAGVYKVVWDGKDNNGNQVPSAVYFHQMIAEDFKQVRKLILQKYN